MAAPFFMGWIYPNVLNIPVISRVGCLSSLYFDDKDNKTVFYIQLQNS